MRKRADLKLMYVLMAVTLLLFTGCAPKKNPEQLRAFNVEGDIKFTSGNADLLPPTAGKTKVIALPTLSGTLSLDDAIAYAMTHNLDAAVSKEEENVQREMETAAMLRMLPSLIANAERSWKSQHVPSKSVNYSTGEESLAPSISSELETSTESVELSWDLLDLAVNVNRWRQAGDRVQMRKLQMQRVKQNLALDVTGAYLRAVVAKEAAKQAETVMKYALERQEIIEKQMEMNHIPKVDGLQSSIDIAELMIRLTRYSDEYKAAKTELARLMGLSPSTPFELKGVDFLAIPGPIRIDSEDLDREALLNRPELFELDLEEKISAKEAEISIMRMFPALTPFARYQHDDNKYLTRHDWFVSGLRLSWDLLSIPQSSADHSSALARSKLIQKRRMNMAMAVLTQLRLATIEYDNYLRQVEQAYELENLREELAREVHLQVENGRLKESTLLNADQLFIVAHRARLTAYARLMTARQRILNSLGRDWDEHGKEIAFTSDELSVPLTAK
ncbi:TolC family protein [Desulfovibrio sp. JC022]|uniref:TolC family protein n=1 Tax=Desulfovibrio sp. JC022 TaxID=2593642 RepID=UPI0013D0AE6B|nr:TolC family protein [Desulfovibrio sp. JC022]NDV24537.1 TolC family protein [Desulfovibrio sp. JC022]